MESDIWGLVRFNSIVSILIFDKPLSVFVNWGLNIDSTCFHDWNWFSLPTSQMVCLSSNLFFLVCKDYIWLDYSTEEGFHVEHNQYVHVHWFCAPLSDCLQQWVLAWVLVWLYHNLKSFYNHNLFYQCKIIVIIYSEKYYINMLSINKYFKQLLFSYAKVYPWFLV